ncbi:MAG TPA: hypothetical protein VMV05_03125 [bacterium]|nr:hypothetical protein [bacterium]
MRVLFHLFRSKSGFILPALGLLAVMATLQISCGSKSSPAAPAAPTATPTPPGPTATPTVSPGTPTSTPTNTPTSTPGSPTATPTSTFYSLPTLSPTPTPTDGAAPGVYWYYGNVVNFTYDGATTFYNGLTCQVVLTVNGAAESTCGVTVSGPGVTMPVANSGTIGLYGVTYAIYSADLPVTYQPGGSYSLLTATSAGTAAATLTGPGGITLASDGSQASWAHEGNGDHVLVQSPLYNTTFRTPIGYDMLSPVAIPPSAYQDGPGTYTLLATIMNRSYSITGGSGFFYVSDELDKDLAK